MKQRRTKIIVTLGPATDNENALRKIKGKGVDFVRTNMSHSSVADLERSVRLAKDVGVPFILDTEGSQVRTGDLEERKGSGKWGRLPKRAIEQMYDNGRRTLPEKYRLVLEEYFRRLPQSTSQ